MHLRYIIAMTALPYSKSYALGYAGLQRLRLLKESHDSAIFALIQAISGTHPIPSNGGTDL